VESKARLRRYPSGETIFQRDDPGDFMGVVCSGRVRIVLYSEDGKEVLLNLVEAGEVFGELAMLDGQQRSADALADGVCELLLFHRNDILPVLEQNPGIAVKFSMHLTRLLRLNNDRIEALVFMPLPARLAKILLHLAQRYGQTTSQGVLISDDLNQSDYGQMIASSRESVNKQLRQWQLDGILECSKDGILIKDFPALMRASENIEK